MKTKLREMEEKTIKTGGAIFTVVLYMFTALLYIPRPSTGVSLFESRKIHMQFLNMRVPPPHFNYDLLWNYRTRYTASTLGTVLQ